MSSGKISEDLNKQRSSCKKWSCSLLSILKSSWSSACSHQREFSFTVPQDAVRPSWLRLLQVNAVQTSSQLKVLNCWLCGSDRVRQTFVMSLIRLELLPRVCYSSINSILLPLLEDLVEEETEEVLVIEWSISCSLRWTVLGLKRISSLLVQLTDLKLWIKPYSDLDVSTSSSISPYLIYHQDSASWRPILEKLQLLETLTSISSQTSLMVFQEPI